MRMCLASFALGVALGATAFSSARLAGAEPEKKGGAELPPRPSIQEAIEARLGKPDRVDGSGRAFLRYDLKAGATLTLILSGGRLIGGGAELAPGPSIEAALEARFGKPDRVTGSGRGFLHYDLGDGATLTLVVSGRRVIGAEHKKNE